MVINMQIYHVHDMNDAHLDELLFTAQPFMPVLN